MKFTILVFISILSTQLTLSQKIYKTFSNEICNCLNKEIKQNPAVDNKMMVNKCFQASLLKFNKEIRKEFGDDFFNEDNKQEAYNFGVEVGKILVTDCDNYIKIFVDKTKQENSNSVELYITAEEQYENGNLDEAIVNYTKAITADINNSKYYNARGVAYFAQQEYYKAISDFMKALEINPVDYLACYNLAYSKYKLSDFSGALTDISKSLTMNAEYCESYNLKGLIYNNQQVLDSALVNFQKAFKCDTTNFTYSYNIAYIFYTEKEYAIALEYFDKSLLLGNNDIDLYNYIGNTYDALGDFDSAIEFHTKNIAEGDSTDYIPFYNRSLSYYKKGDYNLALADLQTAYNLDSTDVDLIINLAKTEDKLNNITKAAKYFDMAIEMTPTNAGFYDLRANFHERNKNTESAIQDYTISISLYPEDCEIYFSLGKLYLDINNIEKANQSFAKSLSLGCEKAGEFVNSKKGKS